MATYFVEYSDKAKEGLKKHTRAGNYNILRKIKSFEKELEKHPREGTGHPERLKHYGDIEIWSRRINREHRLVYQIREDVVIVLILSAHGHYEDE